MDRNSNCGLVQRFEMRSYVGSCERNWKIDVRARGMGCVEERGMEEGSESS